MKTRSKALAVFAVLALVLTACGDDDTVEVDPSDLELVTAGTLTVCTDTPYAPMEFIDEQGNYTGFDMELMRAVADDLGLEFTVTEPGWDAITGGLAFEAGECDVAAASITITAERAEAIDFSEPYFLVGQSLLVTEASGISSLAEAGGREIAVQTGTTGHFYLSDEGPDDVEIVEFEDADGPWLALEAGSVDGFMTDQVATQDFVDSNPGFMVVETFDTDEEYGWATKDTPNLLAALNATLAKFQDDGTYDQIYSDWFDA